MTRLLKNLQFARRSATAHLEDDPVRFALLVARRLPGGLVRRAADVVSRFTSADSTTVTALFSDLVCGEQESLRRRLVRIGQDDAAGPGILLRAVEVALMGQQTYLADQLLDRVPAGVRRRAVTEARRHWFDGHMTLAIDTIGGLPDATVAARQLRARLASERRVFSDWTPELPVASDGSGRADEPIRVAHLLTNSLPHTHSGYAYRSQSVLRAQQQLGIQVLPVTRLGYPVSVGKLMAADDDVVDGVRYHRLLTARPSGLRDVQLQRQAEDFLGAAEAFGASVVHTTTDFTNGLVARAVARRLGVPFVYEVRGQLADTWASSRGRDARASERYQLAVTREAEIMRSADTVVTLGDEMKRRIIEAGVPESNVVLCPNAVGPEYEAEPVTPENARRELGLPVDGVFIGTVSSLVDYEGLDTLIAAFAVAQAKRADVWLLIVGTGPAEPSLRNLMRKLRVESRVIFTGRVPADRARLYHQALDVFVVPRVDHEVTRSVTPLKPVEAHAVARPVIASDLPAMREIVEDGVNGVLVRPSDVSSLAAAINRLADDPILRVRLGAAGRRHVLKTRTWRGNARTYQRVYDQLLERHDRYRPPTTHQVGRSDG